MIHIGKKKHLLKFPGVNFVIFFLGTPRASDSDLEKKTKKHLHVLKFPGVNFFLGASRVSGSAGIYGKRETMPE